MKTREELIRHDGLDIHSFNKQIRYVHSSPMAMLVRLFDLKRE